MTNLPPGIERLLTRSGFSCSESKAVRIRQNLVRDRVMAEADAHENGWQLIRSAALAQLSHEDPALVVRALTCLFVVGSAADVQAVKPFTNDPDEGIRRAARTCLVEIRHRSG